MQKKAARQNKIRAALDDDPALRVNELASLLNVSTETIRRDLLELEQAGALKRTYGGAVRNPVAEPALVERLKIMIHERRAIAQLAMTMIEDSESLLIGGGATCLHFAAALRGISRNLVVVTPCYGIAAELASNPLIQVIMLPGFFDGREGLVHGPDTLEAIQRYRVPTAIIGASGVDHTGLSDAMPAAAQIFAAIIQHSARSLILADRTKFNKRALSMVSTWRKGLHLVTDTKPDPRLSATILSANAEISVVNAPALLVHQSG
ncbi:DeoR/GlpR family DNA-binding transcription regulator [Bradyrhizobium yuanmingense]|uniref:DeoR/GlpR family DNA-binding transcription regulator n=1 Tax=Bradyrhizobium yuanmingense TaxID=108015 RepID=UPI0023B9B433|nr:DeoR/GlpR family DNA-binding transcription regulator [Bradyrhizobium yuanmingense]MDF0584926.1 DeoR/GlpR family DNA-binding transcription regulator [Bradyrhizobium yuanmingense]